MPQAKMTSQQKRAMQMGRAKARIEKAAAAEAVTNPQFQNPVFWRSVDPDVLAAVKKAVDRACRAVQKAMAEHIQPQLDEERERLSVLQTEAKARRERVKKLQAQLRKLGAK